MADTISAIVEIFFLVQQGIKTPWTGLEKLFGKSSKNRSLSLFRNKEQQLALTKENGLYDSHGKIAALRKLEKW